MKNIGIVCEYNPFHNGHAHQIAVLKPQGAVVCLMSGNYVQRGEPAILDKMTRAAAALSCGADLVLELPVTCALRSAEGFASGAVKIFDRMGCVDALCFGSESGDTEQLLSTARLLLTDAFRAKLRSSLASGVSFPRARENAVRALGGDAEPLCQPNDILGVEYCKALLRAESGMVPMTIRRDGSYHDGTDPQCPSAAFLRRRAQWDGFVPQSALEVMTGQTRHSLAAGERAFLARLRALSETEFAMLPYGGEGLWRKVMAACREKGGLDEIVEAAKSKRYTRTRIARLLLCAFLGIDEDTLNAPPPYVRALAFNDLGASVIRRAREVGTIPLIHAGQTPPDASYGELERRAADLYGLFSDTAAPEPAGTERALRVCYKKSGKS